MLASASNSEKTPTTSENSSHPPKQNTKTDRRNILSFIQNSRGQSMVFRWCSRRVSFVLWTMAAVLTASSIAIAQEKPEEKPAAPSPPAPPPTPAPPTTPTSTTEDSL